MPPPPDARSPRDEVVDAAPWLVFGHLAITTLARQLHDEPAAAAPVGAAGALALARDELRESLDDGGPFATIVTNSRATAAEAEALAVAAAAELDGGLQELLAFVQHDSDPARISLATLGRVLGALEPGHPGALTLAPDGVLRRSALVDVDGRDRPWSDQRIVVHPAVMWALAGGRATDPDIPDRSIVLAADDARGAALAVVTGADRLRRLQAAADATTGDRFLASPAPDDDAGWAALARQATITGCSLIVDVTGALPAVGRRWIERTPHLSWAITSAADLSLAELPDLAWFAVRASDDAPTDAEWHDHLGDVPRTHPLTLAQLELAGRAFHAHDGDLDDAVRRLVSGRLEQLARRIRPTRGWDDVVLSNNRLSQLRSIVDRYRHAGTVYGGWGFVPNPSRGIVALFSGVSGTGKTLAAEVLAGELGLDVFKLDLSAVVSKFIGETEKNLEEVFDAASGGNLLLFFDEADALFGKRSEVRDARDRYANIEVSYLLQRLEAYDGLVVMATNFERNVDDAFLRRIHTRIEFVLPEAAERAQIWQRNFPAVAPIDGVDVPWLAQTFGLSGGSIRNAAVHAAFLAASAGTNIDMRCVVLGVATELRKMGRLLKPDDFGIYADVVATHIDHIGR